MSERLRLAPAAPPTDAPAGISIRPEGDWLVAVEEGPARPGTGFGRPGLWRVVPDGAGATVRSHDLPGLPGMELDDLVTWAAATRSGERDPDWAPPPRDDATDWLDPSRLTVRSGALLAKGALVHEPGRLALVFDDLARVPGDLSADRCAWVAGLLRDVQGRWRLVRFGLEAHVVRAEVDLSGAPAAWARPLLQLSLEALVWAVEWVLPSLRFLVDPGAASRALELHSHSTLERSTVR